MKKYWLPIFLIVVGIASAASCSAGVQNDTNARAANTENTEQPASSEGGAGKGDVDKAIRKIDFKNFTYEPHCAGEESEKVTVKNGEYSKETKQDDYTDRFYFNVFDVSYGDVDADNKEDAVVLTNCNTGGTGQFTEGFVFTLKGDKPTLMDHIEGGDRAYGGLRSAKVQYGFVDVERNDVGEEGGACCPEFVVTTKYKWNGKELAKWGAETRRELYPAQRVNFPKGSTKTTLKVTVDEIKRYIVGARSGQTLSVSVNTDKATVALIKGEADVDDGPNSFTARLKENGDFVIQVQNIDEKPAEVVITIEIR